MTPPRGDFPPELDEVVHRVVSAAHLPLRERAEVARELRTHFEDGLASGHSVEELLRRFGDPAEAAAFIREARVTGRPATRIRRRTTWRTGMGEVRRELARSVRTLLRSPGYAAVVILTLALGVGANTAVFTVLDSVLLEPLPYPEAIRLVRVYDVWHERPQDLNEYLRLPAVRAYRDWDQVFDGMATLYTYRETGVDLTDGDRAERVVASHVSAGYFETMGVPPLLGRTFREEESVGPGFQSSNRIGDPVAVLSYALWRDRYGSARDILGQTVRLDGRAYEVVGVMPQRFTDPLGSPPDLWLPADLRPRENSSDWNNHYLTGVARLAPGLTLDAAQSRVDALNQRLTEEEPENDGWSVAIRPLQAEVVGARRRSLLWILSGAVALVLLSACVNVANLVFARGLGRDRDVALRGALGSGRGRIVGHLLSETAILAGAGGLAGLVLGTVGVQGLLALAPDVLPPVADPGLSGRVFAFALGSTVFSLLAFGLAPALRLSGTAPADILRGGGRGGTETRGLRRLRNGLVVAQVAVAVTLVASAGLLLRSFQQLRDVDLGVDPQGVLTFEVHLPSSRYPDGASRALFHRRFQEAVRALPEVEASGAVSWLPANGRYHWWSMAVIPGWDGGDTDEDPSWVDTDARVIDGDYFQAMGIDVLRGVRPDQIDPDGPAVAWLNRTAAETAFPDVDPLDQFIYIGSGPRRVVGIVEDIPYDAQGDISRKTYIPHSQYADNRNWALIQTVKARGDLTAVRERIRDVLASLDGDLVLYRPQTLADFLGRARAQERFAMLLMTLFAGLALTLAVVGTYGVMAESVARRRREIGIRLALGAAPQTVRGMVMGASLRLTVVGIVVGLAAVWVAGPWLTSFLFQVEPQDPVSLVFGGGVLLALGMLAGWLPARQATRVHPAESLGSE